MTEPTAPRATVLVVDDEQGFRDLLTFELSSRGFRVETASGGEEAVRRAGAKDIDVVVSDVTMPKGNGLDALSALKAVDPQIEVIMMTGYATLETAVGSMRRGAYDFLTKPFDVEELAVLVEKAAEKRRLSRKVDELQEINRFKSEFLANMSHELRTPMNAILGYTSLHLDRVYGEINAKQEEALKRVEAAGANLLQLINGILDLSKVVAGRMPVYVEDFDLGGLAAEIDSMMDCLAKRKGLTLTWRVPAGLRLRSDKTKVKQILVNLLTNAIKFTAQGGVRVEAEAAADRTLLRVSDTGIGIRAEDIPQLFQEFKQLDASATREYGGTGLGLAISKKFAELLGGAISVDSRLGEGTAFTVSLPSRAPDQAQQAAGLFDAPAPAKRGKTLLSIDDDPEVLALLRDSLQGTGYGFAGALNGEEGLSLARRLKPFAITLDVMMPHRDGWTVLQLLKNDPELSSIPVIMVSILDDKALGFALGVSGYIVKPFDRGELLEKLGKLEAGGPGAAPAGGRPEIISLANERRHALEGAHEP